MRPSTFVLPLTAPEAADPRRFGPKAANLAALGRAGLPTPGGVCLDAQAYRMQMGALGLDSLAQAAAEAGSTQARHGVLNIRLGLLEGAIAPEIRAELHGVWRDLGLGQEAPGVVRSSALVEDQLGTSYSGQFESYLGLTEEDEFFVAVRACWAALWSTRVLRYMAGCGANPALTAMGLLIQPQVAAQVSGGGLSRTADGHMLLSAARGFGSAIAQGMVVPDRMILSREGKLIEAETGRGHHQPACGHGRPDAPHSHSASEHAPCLDRAQAEELSGLLRRAEQTIGAPVEIEWVLDSGGFKLLQARPLRMQAAVPRNEIASRGAGLRGQGAGIGWGSGRACVIQCECELSRVAPGDVLVTTVAGPALSHILPHVAGVVAELGGSTSHLAALARERGIPMVLGVQEATRHIPDGVEVAVDGVAGLVHWMR